MHLGPWATASERCHSIRGCGFVSLRLSLTAVTIYQQARMPRILVQIKTNYYFFFLSFAIHSRFKYPLKWDLPRFCVRMSILANKSHPHSLEAWMLASYKTGIIIINDNSPQTETIGSAMSGSESMRGQPGHYFFWNMIFDLAIVFAFAAHRPNVCSVPRKQNRTEL